MDEATLPVTASVKPHPDDVSEDTELCREMPELCRQEACCPAIDVMQPNVDFLTTFGAAFLGGALFSGILLWSFSKRMGTTCQ